MQKLVSLTLHCRTGLCFASGQKEVIIHGISFRDDEVEKGICAPFSINLLRSVAPHSRSMSQFISFISSSLALIICRSCCRRCCCASCLALPWSCILCGAESVSLNGFGFGFATFTFTYSHSYSHTHIRMYSCAHISCLAAVCGLEYSLVVPKSKPQLNRSTGSYNSNRHNNNTATTTQQQQLQQLGATKYEIISFEAVEIK